MRAGILWAAVAVLWSFLSGPAIAQEENTVLEGAKKFCVAEYGERLLEVTLDGEDGFACRFAAVEKIATYKLAPAEPAPKWDLDEEAEAEAEAAAAAKAVAAAKLKRNKAKLRKKRRYKRAKLRKRKRHIRRKKASRAKKRDPIAEFVKKVRRATAKRRSEVRRKLKKSGFTF